MPHVQPQALAGSLLVARFLFSVHPGADELPVVLAPSSQINSTDYSQDIGPDKSGKIATWVPEKTAILRLRIVIVDNEDRDAGSRTPDPYGKRAAKRPCRDR